MRRACPFSVALFVFSTIARLAIPCEVCFGKAIRAKATLLRTNRSQPHSSHVCCNHNLVVWSLGLLLYQLSV